MSHVRATDIQGVFPPPVDLARGRRPHDIVEEYISAAKSTILYYFHADMRLRGAYEAMLNVGESTGGLRNAWGNIAVLEGRSRWKICMDAVIVQLTLSKAS